MLNVQEQKIIVWDDIPIAMNFSHWQFWLRKSHRFFGINKPFSVSTCHIWNTNCCGTGAVGLTNSIVNAVVRAFDQCFVLAFVHAFHQFCSCFSCISPILFLLLFMHFTNFVLAFVHAFHCLANSSFPLVLYIRITFDIQGDQPIYTIMYVYAYVRVIRI